MVVLKQDLRGELINHPHELRWVHGKLNPYLSKEGKAKRLGRIEVIISGFSRCAAAKATGNMFQSFAF